MSEEATITNEETIKTEPPTDSIKAARADAPSFVPSSETEDTYDYFEEEKPSKKILHFAKKDNSDFSRDEWILSHISEEHMMEYLKLEQKRSEQLQQAKEVRERRLFTAFQLTVSLAAVVAVVFLLRDNPTILINILYLIGILAVLWLWKNPKDKK